VSDAAKTREKEMAASKHASEKATAASCPIGYTLPLLALAFLIPLAISLINFTFSY